MDGGIPNMVVYSHNYYGKLDAHFLSNPILDWKKFLPFYFKDESIYIS